ncbi:alpha/beta hydrolase [Lutibacter flavus]|uniref:Esterase n=1 Tax=Lutibacter flavus TaxID=691689 RepID=A0A238VDD0_9FLAO|nr:alpha/beta hydrolase-fold protein [Lutibacter flavus]SNR32405.1 hypothetical protein SAMN04488111_0327 [Lutibacter flavus]
MKDIKLVIIFLIFGTTIIAQIPAESKTNNSKPFSIGETVEIHSKILNEQRVLNIYLPFGYSKDSIKKYPVIYLLDGSADEDFIHISGLVQFGSYPWINILPESIVVGISNIDRRKNFTFPTNNERDKIDFPTTGSSETFINFLEKELQPFIETNYHTKTTKTIIGQSLGGLLATEILFKKPDLFNNYIIVSPSLWWDDESLLNFKPIDYMSNKSIYIAVGKEGEVMQRVANELYEKLNTLNTENTNLYFEFLERLDHGDTLHLAVYNAFEKIFKSE